MANRSKAVIAIIACVLFWGFSFISIKITVAVFPPMTLGAIRFAIALVFLFFIKQKIAPKEKIRKEDLPVLAGAGLMGVTVYFFFQNVGVALIPASEASIIVGSIPVIALVAEGLRDRITAGKKAGFDTKKSSLGKTVLAGAGALISLSGVVLVAGVSFALSGSAAGYFFMGGACISWVCYSFLTASLFNRRSRIYIVFWQSLIGFLGFLPFVVFEGSWQMPGFHVWIHVLFLGICCSALAYWLYVMALRDLGVGTATLFLNFIPVVSAIGAYLVLGERLQPLQLFGAVLVLAGVYLAMAVSSKKD